MSQLLTSPDGVATIWRHDIAPIIIGKDLLELVSTSMYVDPIMIYREYVQNAADSIDEARSIGLLGKTDPGRVEILIDANNRTVRIRDNGTGIGRDEFEERLSAFGASSKRGTDARGFRGIGRLAGLGYCQELIFRSRTDGYAEVSEMHWDCKSIKAILRTPDNDSNLQEVVNRVVNIQHVDGSGWPAHFFEVELRGVIRAKNDALLNNFAVYEFLSEVAPVPFSPDFKFGEEIISTLSANISLGNLEVSVEGIKGFVYRPHRNSLQARGGVDDDFVDLEICQIPSVDGQAGAIAWILHHGYKGAISVPQIRGLRLRSGNIQIGGHDLLEDLFPEPRFNSWAVGEIHTFDKRIVPNGRRDLYEQNIHFNNLTNHIAPVARQISARCRQSSIIRNLLRDFNRRETLAREKLQAIRQGGLNLEDRQKQLREIDELIAVMRRLISRGILPADVQNSLRDILSEVEKNFAKMRRYKRKAKPLRKLPQVEREAYERVIAMIYECSTNQVGAHALVERILTKMDS